ncbi:cyclic nucleotide-gated cation channel alpha-3 isoform X2 [Nematostella vectensis]|uniref:cyclic nucleotide-gated cation channel alpha-3 isoform X2 n=1 Tax=Nematostella vectensis TaxID=45351 RepID=UPI002077114B|nr:cyclic nucleotide-gated cation channel alpha-3 isoform X2 [Nematostella vectensis]
MRMEVAGHDSWINRPSHLVSKSTGYLGTNLPRTPTLAEEVLSQNVEEAEDFVHYEALQRITKDGNGKHSDPAPQNNEIVSELQIVDSRPPPGSLQLICSDVTTCFENTLKTVLGCWDSFVIDPEGGLCYTWAALVTFAVFYNFCIVLLRIAFKEVRNELFYRMIYWPLDVISDIIYLVDILVQFRTAYRDDHGIMINTPKLLALNYCSKIPFFLDALSVFPLETTLPFTLGVQPSVWFRCLRLLKWHCVLRFFVISDLRTNKPNRLRVVKLALYLGLALHWVACGYYMISEYEGLGSNSWVYPEASGEDGKLLRKYIKSLYWSILTLTTIGETPEPSTNLEHVFTSAMFLFGIFVFAAVVGNVGDVISNMNAARTDFQTKMDYIKSYMEHHKVPEDLQNRAKRWAYYAWSRTHALDESDALGMLPLRLRAELAIHVHLATLKKVKIFKDCDEGLLCELVLKLRPQIFSPGDYICRCGEIGREMYIINHGKVEVVVPDSTTGEKIVVASLTEGNYFGEISLLRLDEGRNRRSADVRSVGYSELLCLSQKDLMEALEEYPEAKKVLESQGRDRLQRTKTEGNMLIPRRTHQIEERQELHINLARELSAIKSNLESVAKRSEECAVLRREAATLRAKLRNAESRLAGLDSLQSANYKSSTSAPTVPPFKVTTGMPPCVSKQSALCKGSTAIRCSPLKSGTADQILKRLFRAAQSASQTKNSRALCATNDTRTTQTSPAYCLASTCRGTEHGVSTRKRPVETLFLPEIRLLDAVDGDVQLLRRRRFSVNLPVQRRK